MIDDRFSTLVAHQNCPYVVIARELQNRLPAVLKAPIAKMMFWLGLVLSITWQVAQAVSKYPFGKVHKLIFRDYISVPIYECGNFITNIGIFMCEIRHAQLYFDQLREESPELALQLDSLFLDSIFGRNRSKTFHHVKSGISAVNSRQN